MFQARSPPNRLRVLHIASGDLWAGAEVMLYGLVRAQKRFADVSVSVILFNDGILARKLREEGIELFLVPESTLGIGRIIKKTRRIVKQIAPDVVHTHRLKEDIVGALATTRTGSNCRVRTVHGVDEGAVTRARAAILVLHRVIVRHRFALTVAVSKSLADRNAREFGDQRVRYVANGIDITPAPAVAGISVAEKDTMISVGIVGRLVSVKRVDIFLRAAALAVQVVQDRLEFRVYGEGPKKSELVELADKLGLNAVVRFMGFCEDMARPMQQLDLLCLTSDAEGLPMVVLEAMAHGVPVIASAVGDIPDVLEYGACGTLVESREPEEFAKEIIGFATAPEHFREKCRRAADRVQAAYSARACAQKYLECYRDAIRRSVSGW